MIPLAAADRSCATLRLSPFTISLSSRSNSRRRDPRTDPCAAPLSTLVRLACWCFWWFSAFQLRALLFLGARAGLGRLLQHDKVRMIFSRVMLLLPFGVPRRPARLHQNKNVDAFEAGELHEIHVVPRRTAVLAFQNQDAFRSQQPVGFASATEVKAPYAGQCS